MYNPDDVIYFRQNNRILSARVMTAATVNLRNRRQSVLFYTVLKNDDSFLHVNPEQIVPYRQAINVHLKNKLNFQKLQVSIANIQGLQNLPADVRRIILKKINGKLAILNDH